jgi:hypothetical protein
MLVRALFFGAAMVAATAAQASNTCNLTHLNLATLQNVAVMPVPAPPDDMAKGENAGDKNLEVALLTPEALVEAGVPSGGEILGYTRLRIVFTSCETEPLRRYGQESRSAIERFFVGKIDNHVLKFDAQVDPIGVKASTQLYSMLRNSSKDGQSWTTDIRNNDYLLPYFRLDTSSILTFSADFQSEGSSKFDIGSSILDIVEQGSKLITPTAVLITDENIGRFNDAARFVDESLSKLFYKKVTETARQGIAIKPTEYATQHLVSVVLIDPDPTKTYITTQRPGRVVGQWDVYAERIRKSLFASVDNDAVNIANLDPASVLNFKIGDKEILRDRLASSEAISKAAKAMAQASETNVGEPAIGFCRLIAMEAARVGLAPHDMALAAWAYLADQAMVENKHKAAAAACQQVRYFPRESHN